MSRALVSSALVLVASSGCDASSMIPLDGGSTPQGDGSARVDGGATDDASVDAALSDAAVDPAFAHFYPVEVPEETRDRLDRGVLDVDLPTTHPRIFGTDDVWLARVRPFETLDPECAFEGSTGGWGEIHDVRATWWSSVWDGDPCAPSGLPMRPEDHVDMAFYLAPPADEGNVDAHHDRQLRVLFLIRREMACQRAGGTDCRLTEADLDRLIVAFVDYEMARLRGLERGQCGYVREWHRTSHLYMDINAPVGFRFFALLLDTLDGHPALSTDDRAYVAASLRAEIDSYLCSLEGPSSSACGTTLEAPCDRPTWNGTTGAPAAYPDCHWSICGGNNWTPLLNVSALYWVIQFHDEDPDRAERVLAGLLATNWLHRRHMLTDGTYTEGSSYVELSYGPSREMNALMLGSFGQPLHSYRWGVLDRTGQWLVESMAPDGRSADFGDAHDGRGFSAMTPIEAPLWQELVGMAPLGSVTVDPCLATRFFENVYYAHGFDNPWVVEPALARDWASIADECAALGAPTMSVYEDQVEAISTLVVPGATELAASSTRPLYRQADRVWLAVAGSPNDFPHREADFGAMIWSAYGHRLLYDFGYGQIFHFDGDAYVSDGIDHLDYALGSNELVIDEAGGGGSYRAQFLGEHGTVERRMLGTFEVSRLDGSAVYGSTRDDGWLDVMRRWMIPLDGGVHLVVDAFRTRGDRALTVEELFYTADSAAPDCTTANSDVVVTRVDPHTIGLTPRCSELLRAGAGYAPSETLAQILAASTEPGTFERGLPTFLAEDPALAPDIVDGVVVFPTRTGGEVRREPFRYAPAAAATSDVRAFLLVPGTTTMGLPDATLARVDCAGASCFDVTVSGRAMHVVIDDATLELAIDAP